MSASSLISGICIDLDHVVDYAIAHGMRFRLGNFFSYFYEERYRKLTLILHGWEWLLLLFTADLLVGWNSWITGAFIGWSQHMFFDRAVNISNFRSYSLLWRWHQKFETDKLLLRNRKRPCNIDSHKSADST